MQKNNRAVQTALWLILVFGSAVAPAQEATQQKPADAQPPSARANQPGNRWAVPYEFNGQMTFIPQTLFRFRSPYSGKLSMASRQETEWTQTYTVYVGFRPLRNLDIYVDPEWALGGGIGGGAGIAAYTNGDVLRVPPAGGIGASAVPYFARAFVRYTTPVGRGEASKVDQSPNQIGGTQPPNRLTVSAGKLATPDVFDVNSYANTTRTQFMNWALINNAAFDYAADLRGYSSGTAVEWIHATWALRAGSFSMPTSANGPKLASIFAQNRGDQIELEEHPKVLRNKDAAVVRLLAYRNVADMGTYSKANEIAKGNHTIPDIVATRKPGTVKYGFGLNLEQPLGDGGDTGVFARLGWDDGKTESFAFTECDATVSAGLQLSGKRWRMPLDRMGLAIVIDGLSGPHRQYLALGGVGFIIGDGKLNYGQEQVVELYYTHRFPMNVEASFDVQVIRNPGYNQDRGPVPVVSGRLHWSF